MNTKAMAVSHLQYEEWIFQVEGNLRTSQCILNYLPRTTGPNGITINKLQQQIGNYVQWFPSTIDAFHIWKEM